MHEQFRVLSTLLMIVSINVLHKYHSVLIDFYVHTHVHMFLYYYVGKYVHKLPSTKYNSTTIETFSKAVKGNAYMEYDSWNNFRSLMLNDK